MGTSYHSLILKDDGTLWSCGQNMYGQLGLGDVGGTATFTQVTTNADDVKQVYCGTYHTFILKNDGTLWGCGYNSDGGLGLGNSAGRSTFTQVTTNADDVKSVYCGYIRTLILKNDGTLWGCGYNSYGQLGLGDTSNRYTFTQATTNTNDIKQVSCGYSHTIILKDDGTLWGCGYNGEGGLGLGDTGNRYTFTQTTINDVKSVYCGAGHTLILKNDGTLWGCGRNAEGQLGLGDTTNRTTFTQITANADNVKSVYCGYSYTLILKNDGTLWGTGNIGNGGNTFTEITTNADNIKQIYCGDYHTLILKNDGTLWGCGNNDNGQLGLGGVGSTATFTEITTNTDDIKFLPDQYEDIPFTIKVYDLNTGLIETLDTNNFKNIPVDKFEKIKVLYTNPTDTLIAGLISFDNKTTWKVFDGIQWNNISNLDPDQILTKGMSMDKINNLDKNKLIAGGFTGNMDFKIAMRTNDVNKTPSITKIYIEYKNN